MVVIIPLFSALSRRAERKSTCFFAKSPYNGNIFNSFHIYLKYFHVNGFGRAFRMITKIRALMSAVENGSLKAAAESSIAFM